MKKPKQPSAYYLCATVEIFNIQVILIVGDFDACCKLIEDNRDPDYRGPKISDGLRVAKGKLDEECRTRNGYAAFTTHINPVIIIYAPKAITLSCLVHEISHAVDFIFLITGCGGDGELRAYLCQYLFNELAEAGKNVVVPEPAQADQKEAAK